MSRQMQAAVYYANSDVRVEEMPVPDIGPGEILMRVESSGICGSDVMEWYRRDKVPLVLGHEVAGIVEEVGAGVEGHEPGDRIVAAHHVPCNTCRHCLRGDHTMCRTLQKETNFVPGGFSQYLKLPGINVDRGIFPIPEGVSLDEASFAEPLACVLRGQARMRMKPGDSVFIIGAGISGMLHIALARAMGAGFIVAADISEYRLDMTLRMGADEAVLASDSLAADLVSANHGRKAEGVIISTGAASAVRAGLESAGMGGTVLLFAPTGQGVQIPMSVNDLFWKRDLTLTTTYAGAPADYAAALELIRSGAVPVADMITHVLALRDIQKGFDLVSAGGESMKVIVRPWD